MAGQEREKAHEKTQPHARGQQTRSTGQPSRAHPQQNIAEQEMTRSDKLRRKPMVDTFAHLGPEARK